MVSSLRTLLVAPQPFFTPRGTPIAVRTAAEVLTSLGHEVDILTLAHGEDVDLPGVRVFRAKRAPLVRSVPIGLSFRKALSDVMLFRAARSMVRERRYDVVHGVEEGAFIAWWLHRRTGHPFIYDMDSHLSAQIDESGRSLWPAARIVERIERAVFRDASGVLAVCPALREVAARHHPRETVRLLPDEPLQNGEQIVPSAEVEGIGGTRLVYVGNLEPYQGIDLLLEAFRSVASEEPEARLVIVGGSPKRINHYSRMAEPLVEKGQLHFLGPRPLADLGSILAAADILVSPRLQGVNTPMKIYSYLESGRPTVATRMATHTQVLSDQTACLVDPNPEALAEGLIRLIGNPDLRRRLGEAGRRHVRDEYGPERFRERLRAFYDDLADRLTEHEEPVTASPTVEGA